jgi:ketosteroid isomerase-like protein
VYEPENELIQARIAAARQWIDGMNHRDLPRALGKFDDDGSWMGFDESQQRKRYYGKDAIVAYLHHFTVDICKELHYEVTGVAVTPGADKVMIEWTDEGKSFEGPIYRNQGVISFTFGAGANIVDARSYFDTAPLTPHSWTDRLAKAGDDAS